MTESDVLTLTIALIQLGVLVGVFVGFMVAFFGPRN